MSIAIENARVHVATKRTGKAKKTHRRKIRRAVIKLPHDGTTMVEKAAMNPRIILAARRFGRFGRTRGRIPKEWEAHCFLYTPSVVVHESEAIWNFS
jgi:hypothetical protein